MLERARSGLMGFRLKGGGACYILFGRLSPVAFGARVDLVFLSTSVTMGGQTSCICTSHHGIAFEVPGTSLVHSKRVVLRTEASTLSRL